MHAPSSALNNQFAGSTPADKWTSYLSALDNIGDYGCLGITDYFSVQGYLKVLEYKKSGGLQNVAMLLPNIELRIVPVTDKNKAINLHVLACPSIANELNDLLFINLKFQYRDESYPCTQTGLVALGRAFHEDSALAEEIAYKEGIGQFKVELSDLRSCLNTNARLRRNVLIVVANSSNDGNSGIKDSGLKALRREIYSIADCIFSGNPNDRAHFLGVGMMPAEEVEREYGSLKPCIHGCDAHDLEKLGKPDQDRFTWIKADPTFEGLKQICHEPEGRVHIGPFAPATPIHRIVDAALSFPSHTVLRWGVEEQPFCFRGKHNIAFAAGLTCVIGGRGAGKSTLLNLLHERLAPGLNEYFTERAPKDEGATVSIPKCVSIEYFGDQSGIEFISQNQVEQFAMEPQRLTQAILARLRAQDTHDLSGSLSRIEAARDALHRKAALVSDEANIAGRIAENVAAQASLNALVSSFAEPEYVQISKFIQDGTAALRTLQSDRKTLRTVVEEVETTVLTSVISPTDNIYTQTLTSFLDGIRIAIETVRHTLDLSAPGTDEEVLEQALQEKKVRLTEFLTARGLEPENMTDVAAASTHVADLRAEEDNLRVQLDTVRTELSTLEYDHAARGLFEERMVTVLTGLNELFANVHKDVKKIELRYFFDTEMAEDSATRSLVAKLPNTASRTLRADHVKQELEKAGPVLDTELAVLVDTLRHSSGKTAEGLDAYFGVDVNQRLWEIERFVEKMDVQKYMRLEILYDGKPLKSTSFGQRCSAVLIVLLSLGNAPIVIDEPEAHLDSAIIANYLVALVKKVKTKRQIIFATHNANFVVNGDAELIHVVSMDNEGRSVLESFTIEDTAARPMLLALEGGEAAFRQREGRYALT